MGSGCRHREGLPCHVGGPELSQRTFTAHCRRSN
jgi:hypothetical protein